MPTLTPPSKRPEEVGGQISLRQSCNTHARRVKIPAGIASEDAIPSNPQGLGNAEIANSMGLVS